MSSADAPMPEPEVALVFPPLVETSFGTYFPSTAVLAGYLGREGVSVLQVDLNEQFALHLVSPEWLATASALPEGRAPSRAEATVIAAARALSKRRDALFDAEGRHLFVAGPGRPVSLLLTLAEPHRIDAAVADLVAPAFMESAAAGVLRAFYETTRFAEDLPASVHTVGISVPMGPQLAPTLVLADHLRRVRPDLTILLGGPTVSLMALPDLDALLLRYEGVIDAVVRFDGEVPLAELVAQRRAGRIDPTKVAGVSAVVNGGVIHVPPGPGPRLDDLPYPDYAPEIMRQLGEPSIAIIQARGCYWGKCTYCDFVELYKGSGRYRTKTAPRFVDEIEHQVARHGVRRFVVITESIPATFARNMSALLLERKLEVAWDSFAMVDKHFTEDTFALMAQAGCAYLVIGMETMTDRVLRLVEKAGTKDENLRFLANAHKSGIRLRVNLIPDLPTTTYDEAMEALAIFDAHRETLASVAIFPFEATRSSKIGREPRKYGLLPILSQEGSGQAQFASNRLPVIDAGMTDAERTKVHAAYRAFQVELTTSRAPRKPEAVALDGARFALDHEACEMVPVDDGLFCLNVDTRQRNVLARGWIRVLASLRDVGSFSLADLASRLGDAALARTALEHLLDRGVFRLAAPAEALRSSKDVAA